jgi:hypothetical protein
LGEGTAVAGGGTLAFNKILGLDNAYIESSNFTVSGDVDLSATNSSTIDATCYPQPYQLQ